MVHIYTHSVLNECVVESQSQGGEVLASANLSFFLHPAEARIVCASARSDASMAALVRAAAARRGRTKGWDIGNGALQLRLWASSSGVNGSGHKLHFFQWSGGGLL